ncbi:hypothetical protein [Virgibacillus sp. DJP39]|uniref:hypothetical protein n=1 Tax=Virgibacillus sp. DJP39 TaxID=3409790 RepID=UPI003BB6F62D
MDINKGNIRIKLWSIVSRLICIVASFYFVYLAFNSSNYIIAALRGMGALFWVYLAVPSGVEAKKSSSQEIVRFWFYKEKPKGLVYFVLTKGVVLLGATGFLIWLSNPNLEAKENLLLSASTNLVTYLLGGFFMGWFVWRSNDKKAKKLGLYKEKN